MTKELLERETEEALRKIHFDEFGSVGEGGTVIKESSLKNQPHWPDYSNLQMSPQKISETAVVYKKRRTKKKK